MGSPQKCNIAANFQIQSRAVSQEVCEAETKSDTADLTYLETFQIVVNTEDEIEWRYGF